MCVVPICKAHSHTGEIANMGNWCLVGLLEGDDDDESTVFLELIGDMLGIVCRIPSRNILCLFWAKILKMFMDQLTHMNSQRAQAHLSHSHDCRHRTTNRLRRFESRCNFMMITPVQRLLWACYFFSKCMQKSCNVFGSMVFRLRCQWISLSEGRPTIEERELTSIYLYS